MRSLFITFVLLTSFTLKAAELSCNDNTSDAMKSLVAVANAIKEPVCPNPEHMGGSLCSAIAVRSKDSSGQYDFHYQRIVHEAACVEKTDSEEEKIKKIQKMWKELEDRIICDNLSFSVHRGSVVKFAVDSLNDDFIFDVTYMWKVDLNHVDESDNRTVLDFVRDEIERHKGRAIESSLKSYYEQLKAAGAKHKSEL